MIRAIQWQFGVGHDPRLLARSNFELLSDERRKTHSHALDEGTKVLFSLYVCEPKRSIPSLLVKKKIKQTFPLETWRTQSRTNKWAL